MRELSQRSANLRLHLGPRKNEGIAEFVTGRRVVNTYSNEIKMIISIPYRLYLSFVYTLKSSAKSTHTERIPRAAKNLSAASPENNA
jgi:hypothetical protein